MVEREVNSLSAGNDLFLSVVPGIHPDKIKNSTINLDLKV
jgi:hypothetical protein